MKVKDMVEGEFYVYSHPKQTWGRPQICFLVSKAPHRKRSSYSSGATPLGEGADKRGSGVAVYFLRDPEYYADDKNFIDTLRPLKPADRFAMLAMMGNERPLAFAMTGGITMTLDRRDQLQKEQEIERKRYEKERAERKAAEAKAEAERVKKAKELDLEFNTKLAGLGLPLKVKDGMVAVGAGDLIKMLETRP